MLPIGPGSPGGVNGAAAPHTNHRTAEPSTSFAEVLARTTGEPPEGDAPTTADGIHVSHHASRRLASRRIDLSGPDLARLAKATDQAASKGARDSLVLMDGLGLIVNVPNRTVVTALDVDRMDEGVVTHIDSTIFVPRR